MSPWLSDIALSHLKKIDKSIETEKKLYEDHTNEIYHTKSGALGPYKKYHCWYACVTVNNEKKEFSSVGQERQVTKQACALKVCQYLQAFWSLSSLPFYKPSQPQTATTNENSNMSPQQDNLSNWDFEPEGWEQYKEFDFETEVKARADYANYDGPVNYLYNVVNHKKRAQNQVDSEDRGTA